MSWPEDGDQRDCLDCNTTLEYDSEEGLWFHLGDAGDCPRNRPSRAQ